MITPQTYIQVYIYIYIHIKPLPVPRVFGARSGSPRIIMYTIMNVCSTPLRLDLGDMLELTCRNISNLFIQVCHNTISWAYTVSYTSASNTCIHTLYRLIKFSTTAAMQVLVQEHSYTMASAFQAVHLGSHWEKILKISIIQWTLRVIEFIS